MTMDTKVWLLDVWEDLKFFRSFWKKNWIFNKNLTPEDDTTEEI